MKQESPQSPESTTDEPAIPRAWHHPWRLFKFGMRLLVYGALLLLVFAALLVGTPFGARLSVGLASSTIPNFSAQYLSGSINKALALSQVSWHMDGLLVEVNTLILGWQPACLLTKTLCIKSLSLQDAKIAIDSQELAVEDDTEETAAPLLPFDISLENADFSNVDVSVDEMQFSVASLKGSAKWRRNGLWLHQLNTDGLVIELPSEKTDKPMVVVTSSQDPSDPTSPPKVSDHSAKTTTATGNTQPVKATADSQKTDAIAKTSDGLPKVTGDAHGSDPAASNESNDWPLANLPTLVLPLDIHLDSAELTNSRLSIGGHNEQIQQLQLGADLEGPDLTIRSLEMTHPDGKLTLKGTLSLKDDYPLALTLDATTESPSFLPSLGKQTLEAFVSGSLSAVKLAISGHGSQAFHLKADANLTSQTIPFNATLSEGKLGWPFIEPEYHTKGLSIKAKGDLNEQQAEIAGMLETPFHPPLQVTGSLSQHHQLLEISSLTLNGEPGSISLLGNLNFKDALSWRARLALEQLTPTALTLPPDMWLPSGVMNGSLDTEGHVADTWQVKVLNANLAGELEDMPVSVQGDISLDNNLHVSARDFHIEAMEAELTLDGTVTDSWSLKGFLKVPDLSHLNPELAGSVFADLNVVGKQQQPRVNVRADAKALAYGKQKMAELTIDGHYLPLSEHQFGLTLSGSELALGARLVDTLILNAEGDLHAQQLKLNSNGDLRLGLLLHSKFDDKKRVLNAVLSQFSLDSEFGDWSLAKELALSWQLDARLLSLGEACLVQEHGQICLPKGAHFGETGDMLLSYQGEPGSTLTELLPADMAWHGKALMTARVGWASQEKPAGRLSLQFEPGDVTVHHAGGQQEALKYEKLSLDAALTPQKLTAKLALDSSQLVTLTGFMDIDVAPDRALLGQIKLDRLKLNALKGFIPPLNTLEGEISGTVSLNGSLMMPEVSGVIALRQGAFSLNSNPTLISDANLEFDFAGQRANLNGNWLMGKGPGKIKGTISWPEGNFEGSLAIQGDKLALIVPPMAILDVSPDLNLVFDANMLDVKGNVEVPSGHIKLVLLEDGGVPVSDDVVFVDAAAISDEQESPFAITADINIKVGKKMAVDGLGLKSHLAGTLRFQQQAFKPPQLFGGIKVIDGSYKFMGQSLKIATGEVEFVGPLRSPSINIEAVREIKDEDLVAGIRITGSLARPEAKLFSNPSKEQAEILSYILKGKGFSSNGSEDNDALMMTAALALGSTLTGGSIGKIGQNTSSMVEKLGFSNVQLDTNDEGRVAISGFIGEKLMVKYSVGVFNPGHEMTVRYYLLTRLYMEMVSGTLGQSLDIYYSFDL